MIDDTDTQAQEDADYEAMRAHLFPGQRQAPEPDDSDDAKEYANIRGALFANHNRD